jgi:hypothetical protein
MGVRKREISPPLRRSRDGRKSLWRVTGEVPRSQLLLPFGKKLGRKVP